MYQWDFGFLSTYQAVLAKGLWYTLFFTVATIVSGMFVGLVIAMARLSPYRLVQLPFQALVEVFRCTPLLVQLVWFYYALPVILGIELSAAMAGFMTLTLYGAAFYSEIIRAGIVSIEAGQREAAQALGMRGAQVMRRIILPQAFKRMVPPLMNQSILQLKNTSLISVLALPDLLYQGQLIAHEIYKPLEVYTTIAVLYFLVLFPATLLARRYERRLAVSD